MEYNKNRNSRRSWNNRHGASERKEDQERREARNARREALAREEQENIESIKHFKQNMPECPRCHKPITELSSALAEKGTGEPVHFDCVLEYLQSKEKLMPGQKISYIGQGRFAILYFPNVNDPKNFTIERIIEWEERDKKYEWRTQMASLFSQVR